MVAHPRALEQYDDSHSADSDSEIHDKDVALSIRTTPRSKSKPSWDRKIPTSCPSQPATAHIDTNGQKTIMHTTSTLPDELVLNEACYMDFLTMYRTYLTKSSSTYTEDEIACDIRGWKGITSTEEMDDQISTTHSPSIARLKSAEEFEGASYNLPGMKRGRECGQQDDNAQVDGGNEDDDYANHGTRSPKRRRHDETDETMRRFACPFYKNAPAKHGDLRTCNGPGWPNIYRLKEHLFRRHKNSLGEALEAKLKTRASKYKCQTEAEKWNHIYRLLFPDCPPNAVPHPYYDHRESSNDTQNRIFESLRQELPQIIARRIQDRTSIAIPDDLPSLQDLITQSVDDMWSRFSDSPSITTSESESPPRSPDTQIMEYASPWDETSQPLEMVDQDCLTSQCWFPDDQLLTCLDGSMWNGEMSGFNHPVEAPIDHACISQLAVKCTRK